MTITMLNELSESGALLLWKATWQGGAALLLVFLVTRAVRRIPASAQCWLWRLAFLKLFIAGLAIASISLPCLPPAPVPTKTVPVKSTMPAPAPESTTEQPILDVPTTTSSSVATETVEAPPPAVLPRLSLTSYVMLAWLTGALVCVVNLGRQWVRVRRMVSGLQPLDDAALQKSLLDNCLPMRVTASPELRIGNESGGPCLVGAIRPIIVLPSTLLQSCSAEALNAALMHELAHIKRRDLLWNWLPALAEVLFYFHPLVWLARREWRLAQEIATDELALKVSQVDVARYARLLMELVAQCHTATIRPHLAVGVSETYTQISRRMTAMLTLHNLAAHRRGIGIAVIAVAVCGVLPLKLTRWQLQAQPESPATASSEDDARQKEKQAAEAAEAAARNAEKNDELLKQFAAAEFFWQQADAARKIVARQDKGMIIRIQQFLDVADRHRRCNAAFVMAGLGDSRGMATLIRELHDQQPRPTDRVTSDGNPDVDGQITDDRYYAALLLGELKQKDAVPALITATKDRSINYQAAISLGDIGDKSAIPALQQMLKDYPAQRLWAGYGLAKLGEKEGFDILETTASADSKWTERRHAVEALGKIGDTKSVAVLIKALKDEHANVRVSAAQSLAVIGDPSSLPALTEALKDREATQVNAPTTVAAEAQKAIDAIKQKQSRAAPEKVVNPEGESVTAATLEKWLADKEWVQVTFGGPHMDPLKLRDSLSVKDTPPDFRLTPGEGGRPVEKGGAFVEVAMKVTPETTRDLLKLQTELSPRDYLLDSQQTSVISYRCSPIVRDNARKLVPNVIAAMQTAIEAAAPGTKFTPILGKDRRVGVIKVDPDYLGGFEYTAPVGLKGSFRIQAITSPYTMGALAPDQVFHFKYLAMMGLTYANPDSADSPVQAEIGRAIQAQIAPLQKLDQQAPKLAAAQAERDKAIATPGKRQTFQEIITARSTPNLTTLAARSSPDTQGQPAEESFWDLLKLRETKDPNAVAALQKTLAENILTTRIHGFAAAQALFAIGTPDALQVLDKDFLTSTVQAHLAIRYTAHWEMKEPQRSQFINKYLLTNMAKDLVVEVKQDDQATKPGQAKLVATARNTSEAAYNMLELKGSFELLYARDQAGRMIFDSAPLRIHGPRAGKKIELKPGQTDSMELTLNVTNDGQKYVVEVPETGHRYETTDPQIEFLVIKESQPLLPEQRKFMNVNETWPWWTGRAVSKPVEVDLKTIPAK